MVKKARRRAPIRDPEASRRQLLAAGYDAFVARGYAGARIDRIAAAARVNKALIRYYFGGKRGLYNAVLRDKLTAAAAALAPLRSAPGEAAHRFARLIDSFAAFYAAEPGIGLLLTREQMDGAPNLEPDTVRALSGFFAATRELLADGLAAGRLRGHDPHHVHLAVVGSLLFFQLTAPAREAYARRGLLTGPLPRWEEHVDVVRSILLRGLEGDDAPSSAPRRETPRSSS